MRSRLLWGKRRARLGEVWRCYEAEASGAKDNGLDPDDEKHEMIVEDSTNHKEEAEQDSHHPCSQALFCAQIKIKVT